MTPQFEEADSPTHDMQVAKVRASMQRTDPLSLWTVMLAEGLARGIRAEFPTHQEQDTVARATLFACGHIGGVILAGRDKGLDPTLAVALTNVQATAAVLVLDRIEMDKAEQ
jgi:hypothetical protein